jgi:hypothetical protein
MPLRSAMGRHSVGSPYSRQAMEGSESPATTVCTVRAARPPDVGFCPFCSPAISSMFTVAVPRMGMPPAVKSVYLTVTELT